MAGHAIPTSRSGPGLLPAAARPVQADRLKDASRQFEAIFIQQLLRQMRRSAEPIRGEEPGLARDVYHGWLEEQVAERVAAGGGIGLGDRLFRALQLRYAGQGEK